MPLICYVPKNFSAKATDQIARTNLIIAEYRKQGFNMTLRQLYYQMFARGYIAVNCQAEYNKLGNLVSDARLAGLIDWLAIEDSMRESKAIQHWNTPMQIVEAAMDSYAIDRWRNQAHYVECWVEKAALESVLERACVPLDIRFFACRGYASQSSLWEASQRLLNQIHAGKQVHIIHLGDHDPSGIDMSRDIYTRLSLFVSHNAPNVGEMLISDVVDSLRHSKVHVRRIALNMNQVQKYALPPNFAKVTDSRFAEYQRQFGDESWELDALDPATLVEMITRAVKQFRDEAKWEEALKEEKLGRDTLKYICQYWKDVVLFIREHRKKDTSPVICQDCGATQNNPKCLCVGAGEMKGLLP